MFVRSVFNSATTSYSRKTLALTLKDRHDRQQTDRKEKENANASQN